MTRLELLAQIELVAALARVMADRLKASHLYQGEIATDLALLATEAARAQLYRGRG